MRTWLPSLRTLPSRMVPTLSFSPMLRRSSLLPLNENDEVRPATRRPSTWASASRISSATPSEKYSWSFAGLMSANGSTAMDGATAATARGRPRTAKYQISPGAAASRPIPTSTSVRRGPRTEAEGGVRSMPAAPTSKIHARVTTMGNPTASATTTYETTASGQCIPWTTGSMICSTANAAMPYPTRARKTRLRFSSEYSGRGKRAPWPRRRVAREASPAVRLSAHGLRIGIDQLVVPLQAPAPRSARAAAAPAGIHQRDLEANVVGKLDQPLRHLQTVRPRVQGAGRHLQEPDLSSGPGDPRVDLQAVFERAAGVDDDRSLPARIAGLEGDLRRRSGAAEEDGIGARLPRAQETVELGEMQGAADQGAGAPFQIDGLVEASLAEPHGGLGVEHGRSLR